MLKVMPQIFYDNPNVRTILADGMSGMIVKEMDSAANDKEGYLSTHAVTLVLKGKLRVEDNDGFIADVPAGKMIFLPKGLYIVSDIVPEDEPFKAVMFFFENHIIEDFLKVTKAAKVKERCFTHLLIDYTDNLKRFVDGILNLYDNNVKPPRELVRMKLFEWLILINDSLENPCFGMALATLNNKEKKSLGAFMNTNFNKPLGIEDYAYLTGRSVSTFRRDFKRQFGISPKQWLIDKRMSMAYDLLGSDSTVSVTEAAVSVGYEDVPHFIKTFHVRFGITPKQLLIKRRKEVLV